MMRWFRAAAWLLAGAAAWGQSAADGLVAEVIRLRQQGHSAEARRMVETALAADPANAEAMYAMARLEFESGRARESLVWLTKAAVKRTPTAEDLRLAGLDYAVLEDYVDATHWLEDAVRMDPADAEAWYDLGRSRMMQGNFAGAEQALGVALRIRPRMVKAENNLGVTYEAENRPEDALAAYKQAVAWQAEQPGKKSEQPLLNLGALLVTENRGTDAVTALREAVAIAPRDVKAHEQLGKALEQSGDGPGALEAMRTASTLEPKSARLHFELGQMLRRQGQTEASKAELRLAAELFEGSVRQ